MRNLGGNILFSATDLMRFMGCAHATTLDLSRLARSRGRSRVRIARMPPCCRSRATPMRRRILARLKAAGSGAWRSRGAILPPMPRRPAQRLLQGPEVVFQGAFLSGNWGGWSDFLERVDRPSALGPFSYEVADTKLKRRPHPKHVLQLVLYSDLLTEVQGVAPEFAHVELGDGTRATLRLADYAAYARMARARLEGFVADPPPTRPDALRRLRPLPLGRSLRERLAGRGQPVQRGQYQPRTGQEAGSGGHRHDGSPCQTSIIRSAAWRKTPALRLVTQARLQHARKTGEPAFELRAPEPGKGFDLLPEPQPGDMFYDIEGDPHFEGGLEYLHGVWFDGQFRAFWAHDHAAEARALSDLLDFFRDASRRRIQPRASIITRPTRSPRCGG